MTTTTDRMIVTILTRSVIPMGMWLLARMGTTIFLC